jgi:ribosomal subunit interface protein
LREHLERRLAFALGSFGDRFAHVAVHLSLTQIVGAAPSQRCEIEVTLRPRRVRVADAGADAFKAIENAAGRLKRSITRALERERAWAETTPTATPAAPLARRRR